MGECVSTGVGTSIEFGEGRVSTERWESHGQWKTDGRKIEQEGERDQHKDYEHVQNHDQHDEKQEQDQRV